MIRMLALAVLCCPWALLARDDAEAKLLTLLEADQKSSNVAPGAWPDVGSLGLQNLEAYDRRALAALHTISRNAIRPENRELYDLLEWQIEGRLEQMRVRLYLTPFWQDRRLVPGGGVLGAVDLLWSLPQPAALSDYQERIRKFESVPPYVHQVIALLREAKAARLLPSRQIASQSITGAKRWLNNRPGLTRNYFATQTDMTEAERTLYAPFQSMEAIPTADRLRLQEAARKAIREQVIPALEGYYDVLSQEYLPACPESPSLSQWPNGFDAYRVLLRLSTTTELDPKRVQEFGGQEVKRIRDQMAALVPRTGFQGSLDEFLLHIRRDPEFYFSTDEQLLAAYREALQSIEPLLPRVIHYIPALHLRVEGVRGGAAASYEAPNAKHDEDLVKVEIGTPGIHPKFEVIPLMLHEGLPGHALQHAVARESDRKATDVIAVFKRQARQSTGFGEGWGLYAETLGYRLGLYQTPMGELGALRMELTRAVRIVVDTGIHLSGWTLQQAKDYAAANTGEPEAQVELEVGRALWPGVQPAYTVGEQQIEQMRDLAARKLGKGFDLRAFNDAMLHWGPLPLAVMRHKLKDCLEDRRCSLTLQVNAQ